MFYHKCMKAWSRIPLALRASAYMRPILFLKNVARLGSFCTRNDEKVWTLRKSSEFLPRVRDSATKQPAGATPSPSMWLNIGKRSGVLPRAHESMVVTLYVAYAFFREMVAVWIVFTCGTAKACEHGEKIGVFPWAHESATERSTEAAPSPTMRPMLLFGNGGRSSGFHAWMAETEKSHGRTQENGRTFFHGHVKRRPNGRLEPRHRPLCGLCSFPKNSGRSVVFVRDNENNKSHAWI